MSVFLLNQFISYNIIMKNKEKEELENRASRFWNEAIISKKYGEMICHMQDAVNVAPTKKSKKFYLDEKKKLTEKFIKKD